MRREHNTEKFNSFHYTLQLKILISWTEDKGSKVI